MTTPTTSARIHPGFTGKDNKTMNCRAQRNFGRGANSSSFLSKYLPDPLMMLSKAALEVSPPQISSQKVPFYKGEVMIWPSVSVGSIIASMIIARRSSERGHAKHGWLNSYHTFSFGNYYDPDHMGFRVLRVVNEDRVLPDNGFGTHPHKNMEIISFVISGELAHKDSLGNSSTIRAAKFQTITAGTGITHSKFSPSKEEGTHFYQMWIEPDTQNLTPAYGQRSIERDMTSSKLELVACKASTEGALTVNQDIKLFWGGCQAREEIKLPLEETRYGWVQIVSGKLHLQDVELSGGDGAARLETREPIVSATSGSEFLFFDLH